MIQSLANFFSLLLLMAFINNGYAAQFLEVSEAAGVNAAHHSNTYGVGQAWIDVDRDGWLDLFVTDRDGPNHLFINQGDETFLELPQFANLSLPDEVCNGVVIGDYNNDGWQDIYIACYGPNYLFRNDAGTSFTDVSHSAGVDNPHDSQVAAFADVNNDGFIDLYLVNYRATPASEGMGSHRDAFYINQGDGSFVDMGEQLDSDQTLKRGLAVTFLDYDLDQDMDLYVVNDRNLRNALWRNDGPATPECPMTWCFTDVSVETNTHRRVDGMGIAVGDYDHDGDEDLYFSGSQEQVLLQSQISQGQSVFVEKSDESGLNFNASGWATLFLDADNDSWLDAYLATWGSPELEDEDQFYLNQQDNSFLPVSESSGIQSATRSEGAARGDFNNDGLMDVVVTDPGTQYFLYKNIDSSNQNWVSYELSGGAGINMDALGASIEIQTSGLNTFRKTLVSGGSRGAGNELRLHFGLGSETIVSAFVIWPNLARHEITIEINRINNVSYKNLELIIQNSFE